MANPTTAFGWVMPNSADLVTDLPADFAVFGQGVDTSMQFLLGGTTGQVLSKTSATNMAFTWIANDTGDITGVTAGTGISGGGTSGTVTVTNDMATAITTNGDLIRGTGSGTFARLGIGSTGQVLTVASGIPSWATPASGSTFVGCSVFASAAQSTTQTTDTAAAFNSENYDTDAFHSTTVNNSRITIPAGKGGYYKVTFTVRWNNGSYCDIKLLKNGTRIVLGTQAGNIGGQNVSGSPNFVGTFDLALVATDFIQLALNSDAATGNNLDNCVFSVIYLGA